MRAYCKTSEVTNRRGERGYAPDGRAVFLNPQHGWVLAGAGRARQHELKLTIAQRLQVSTWPRMAGYGTHADERCALAVSYAHGARLPIPGSRE